MTAIETFRALHQSGCFVLPNPWDAGSARFLHHLGFKALATSSAGFAFTRGLPDDPRALRRHDVLVHVREVVTATSLPVNADFQSGYGDNLDALTESVMLCVHTGVAGLSIEDAEDSARLFAREVAIERVAAARRAIDATKVPVVLTARCEAFLVGDPDAAKTSLDRLVAFAEAGADCLYAPGVRDFDAIAEIVKAVAPKPVNVLVSQPGIALEKLAELGVRRVSVGSALARVAWGAFMRAARDIFERGSFDAFANAASFAELNALFERSR